MNISISKYIILFCAAYLSLSIACTNSTANQNDATLYDSDSVSNKKVQILELLQNLKSKHVLGGIHNREPNSFPTQWTDSLKSLIGDYPALWSGDFLFQQENIDHRQTMINEAIRQFNMGAVVNIMWHACNPVFGEPCAWDDGKGVLSTMNDQQWNELFTEGTAIQQRFVGMMDDVASYLQKLKNNNVVVMFRPFHEMNQGKFWWGGRRGDEGTAKLYRWIHDYMTEVKKLDNLIWVWNIQDFDTLAEDVYAYNPGNDYWDVVTLDVYDDATGFSTEKYEAIKSVANGKPMGIGECQKLPAEDVFTKQSDWTFFMGWSELVFRLNDVITVKDLYSSDKVLSLKELLQEHPN